MTGWEHLVVLAAGAAGGVLTSTVGVASLATFPVLVALGIPPVTANASNTVGLTPGALSGSIGYRRELRERPRVTAMVMGTCAIGAVAGALLLLALPSEVFEAAVPWLILLASLLVGIQPYVSRWMRARAEGPTPDRTTMSPATTFFATLTGVYGGYFGAGSGVMMMAVLGLGMDLEFRVVNALKTLAVFAANVVGSVIFVLIAPLDWTVIALLAVGSILGGYLGSHLGRRIPQGLFRVLIMVAGITAAIVFLV